jgi:hypothetical protein
VSIASAVDVELYVYTRLTGSRQWRDVFKTSKREARTKPKSIDRHWAKADGTGRGHARKRTGDGRGEQEVVEEQARNAEECETES